MFNRHNQKSLVDLSDSWYEPKQFDSMLSKEKNRSHRSGLPLAYVFLALTNITNGDSKITKKDYQLFLKKLIYLISENTRDYDLKCLVNNSKIGILLVDTSLDQAKIFIEKISKILFEEFDLYASKFLPLLRSISISSYPVAQIEEGGEIQGVPVMRKNFIHQHKSTSPHQLEEKKSYMVSVKWNNIPAANGTLVMDMPHTLDLFSFNDTYSFSYKSIKRFIDICGALIGLITFTPVMLLVTVMVKLNSRGPVLFKQTRIGYGGKPFTFMKFRTMRVDSDEKLHKEYVKKLILGKNREVNLGSKDKPLYKIDKDPRITKVGHFLRKTSLDELPQLFNVLIGSMSLVGPRPPIPYELENYKSWHHRRVQEVKPGITGLWQVYGRSSTTFNEMVRLDLQYVRKRSTLLDLKILFKTFAAVLNTKGAL